MTPYFSDAWLDIYQGDVRDVLPSLPADSVDCIVTSPPYWGLRDYGTASWVGGEAECDHAAAKVAIGNSPSSKSTLTTNNGKGPKEGDKFSAGSQSGYGRECPRCGATRSDGQLGLERTPEEYVANMVGVFRELRRVLKPSGTCWLNLGDSYATTPNNNGHHKPTERDTSTLAGGGGRQTATRRASKYDQMPPGLKPKDLVGIPWRVAFALQADGWYLRSDIIWAKPNPMPESVTDRPTKSHEYLFLLTKSARYYFDADAVREPQDSLGKRHEGRSGYRADHPTKYGFDHRELNSAGRNLRSVWTIATKPYPGAHFAVFPPELPERCIKAGSSERGVCPECGAPWERVVERESHFTDRPGHPTRYGDTATRSAKGYSMPSIAPPMIQTTGWAPSCRHERLVNFDSAGHTLTSPLEPVPAVVLDPFAGSGTTGVVANRLSRRAILIDLNGDYLKQQLKRNAQTPLGLGA